MFHILITTIDVEHELFNVLNTLFSLISYPSKLVLVFSDDGLINLYTALSSIKELKTYSFNISANTLISNNLIYIPFSKPKYFISNGKICFSLI